MNEYKNIMFFISTVGHGLGGHFYSLRDIANSLSNHCKVCIVNIGKKKSPVLENLSYEVYFIPFCGTNFLYAYKELKKVYKSFNPDILHAFDTEVFFFTRILSLLTRKPAILTKCGGPNPKKFFPAAKNLILFSKENYDYFQHKKNLNLALIPNRIIEPAVDNERINLLKSKYNLDNKFVILRIGRVTKHYQKTIEQTINLVHHLIKAGFTVCFIHIGKIQDTNLLKDLMNLCYKLELSDSVFFEYDDIFIKNASELIGLGDFIVGTGRGFMEASAAGKWILVPNDNTTFPLLVTQDNFDIAFKFNFSPRIVCNISPTENLKSIEKIITNNIKQCDFARQWFDSYFNINNAIEKYLNYYSMAIYDKKIHLSNLILHFIKLIKNFI